MDCADNVEVKKGLIWRGSGRVRPRSLANEFVFVALPLPVTNIFIWYQSFHQVCLSQVKDSGITFRSMNKQEAKEKYKYVKEVPAFGISGESKHKQIKSDCLVALGMPLNKSTSFLQPTASPILDPQSLISLLQQYDAKRTGSWRSQ